MKNIFPTQIQKRTKKTLFVVFLLSFFVYSYANDAYESEIELFTSPQRIYSIDIPEEIIFAGEKISLLRYDLRERFDRELLSFGYMHSTTFLLLKRANVYFPIIEPILKENNIPDDFKYLALIESYFNPRAVSPAKAAGIWQFMPATAEMYGLEVNEQVDERFHIEKATRAACMFIKDAYQKYGNWATVAASYNVGGGRLSAELEKQKASKALDLYLNEETSRYVFRILAAKEIISHPKKYGFVLRKEHLYHTIRTKEIEVSSSVENWSDFAKNNEISFAQLKDFNLWIRDIKLDNPSCKTYKVKIPFPEDLFFDESKINIINKKWLD